MRSVERKSASKQLLCRQLSAVSVVRKKIMSTTARSPNFARDAKDRRNCPPVYLMHRILFIAYSRLHIRLAQGQFEIASIISDIQVFVSIVATSVVKERDAGGIFRSLGFALSCFREQLPVITGCLPHRSSTIRLQVFGDEKKQLWHQRWQSRLCSDRCSIRNTQLRRQQPITKFEIPLRSVLTIESRVFTIFGYAGPIRPHCQVNTYHCTRRRTK